MIRILFLAANPADSSPLRLQEESRAIDLALRQTEFRDQFELQQHWAVQVADLQSLLLRHRPHIVHFSGHGSSTSEIILQDEKGASQPVSEAELKQLFSLLKDNIRCVVLNACYSHIQAAALAEEIDCVIGMSDAIGDEASIRFAAAFYQALGYGRDVKTAFGLGCLQIDLANLQQGEIPQLLATRGDPAQVIFSSQGLGQQGMASAESTQQKPALGSPGGPANREAKVAPSIPITVWMVMIGGFAVALAVLGPLLFNRLDNAPANTPPPTHTFAVASAVPPNTLLPPATPAIDLIIRQPRLTLDEVASVRAYLAGSAPEEEKRNIILALGKPGWSEVIGLLQELIRDSRDTNTRHTAVQALGQIGPTAQSALLWALDLEPENYVLRTHIISTLGQLPDDSKLTSRALRSVLVQPLEETGVLKSAVETLGKLNAVEAVPDIIAMLAGGPQVVRTQAAITLGRFNLPEVKAALRRSAEQDFVIETRVAAINSLIALKDLEAIPLFFSLQADNAPPEIRIAAQDGALRSAAWRASGEDAPVIVAPTPTPTPSQSANSLALARDDMGITQETLTVTLSSSPVVTATYEAGTRVRFISAAPDRLDLALVEFPDGEQGWIAVSAAAWSPDAAHGGINVLWPNGKVIKVAFLDGDAALQEKVATYAQEWTEYANLTFDFGEHEEADVRVSFSQPGSWSFIGVDALSVPKNQPTLNLGYLKRNSPEELIKRTVLHEFGHVVGLSHEMQNPNHTIPWDRQAILDFYSGPPNFWTQDQIEANVFAVWESGSYPGKEFDPKSIMMFPVDNALTHGDYEIGWNNELSEGDKAFVALLYPKPLPVSTAASAAENTNNGNLSFTWFGNIDPGVVGIAGSAAEADAGYETLFAGETFGVFSHAFLNLLRDKEADVNSDGAVSLDEAVLSAGLRLKARGQRQNPLIVGRAQDFALFSLHPITRTNTITTTRDFKSAARPARLEVLLVGINEYEPNALRGPLNDVALFQELLADKDYVAADEVNVTVLADKEAGAEEILAALDALVVGADAETAILFYFSGQNAVKPAPGSPNVREKAIIPAGATGEADYISVAEIARRMAGSAARYKILIIDA
jgi:hypothetical protein